MTPEDAEEYTQSLGLINAGNYRLIMWADQQGIPQALGMTTPEWVTQRLGGYVRMAIGERRQAVNELANEGLNSYQIADVLGVGEATVRRDRKASNDAPESVLPAETHLSDASNDANVPDAVTANELETAAAMFTPTPYSECMVMIGKLDDRLRLLLDQSRSVHDDEERSKLINRLKLPKERFRTLLETLGDCDLDDELRRLLK